MPVSITNQNELSECLKVMKPGMTLSGLRFNIIGDNSNSVDLTDTTILCQERHSAKNQKKCKNHYYRYEVFNNKHLGKGSFGKVFPITATLKLNEKHKIEILKKESNKTRVMKVERPEITGSCAEHEALVGIKIPYLHMKPVIKGVESFKQEQPVHYIVMHKMPGATLDELLKNESISQLNENRKILLLLSLLEALQKLHQKGLVHGDIKPDNIMVLFEPESLKPRVYIIDFGFCNWKGQESKILGNSSVSSPEIFHWNKKSCHSSSDIFSLGQTFTDICDKGLINDP